MLIKLGTRKEREDIKLVSLSIDQIPKSVFNYYTKWSGFIAEDASCRCGFQISGSESTIQHLTVYFCHRGGKGNLGKEKTAATHAKISKAKMGKEITAKHCAKISKAMMGKEISAATHAKMREAKMGKEISAATRAKMRVKSMSASWRSPKMPLHSNVIPTNSTSLTITV